MIVYNNFKSKHPTHDSPFLFTEVIITNRAPNAFVSDLDPARSGPISLSQSDLHRHSAQVGLALVRPVSAIWMRIAEEVQRNAFSAGALPFLISMTFLLVGFASHSGPFGFGAVVLGPWRKFAV